MTNSSVKIQTALFSVTDKSGLQNLGTALLETNSLTTIIASGGTAQCLQKAHINFTPLEFYTGFPECFNGRVKTLSPKIFGGILLRRGKDEEEAQQMGIKAIDLIVCNLYDFKNASKDTQMPMEELIEFMDIGGSTLIRAACKSFQSVCILVDPDDYTAFIDELKTNNGTISLETRKRLAAKAMNLSADYENFLAKEFSKRLLKEANHSPRLKDGQKLRYGENPDQDAWVYKFEDENGIVQGDILSGKELSYNNYDDATVAYNAAQKLKEINATHGIAVIKHGSLCGYATGPTLTEAFDMAWAGDEKSAFGSVIASLSSITDDLIPHLKNKFIEVLIAPTFADTFVAWTQENRPNLRLIASPEHSHSPLLYKKISGGMLVQTSKDKLLSVPLSDLLKKCDLNEEKRVGVVTKEEPKRVSKELFAFSIAAVNFAKSNAIAITREWKPNYLQLLGMGSGQPNRVDSLQRLAIPKAIENLQKEHANDTSYNPENDLANCILASDGFFPFDDSIRYAASSGIKYYIQPGGSKKDDEVIHTADELNLSMVFTGERYFTH